MRLVRIGSAGFDLDFIVAVDGDRVVFRDGKEIRVSRKAAEGLLAVLPEWTAADEDARREERRK